MLKVCSDRRSVIRLIILAVVTVAAVAADIISKQIIINNMKVGESVTLIPGLLRLTYIRNSGAAFGMLADKRWVFLVLSVVIIVLIFGYALFKGVSSKLSAVSLGLIAGGGVGNMIERVIAGDVTDFIDFYFIPAWKWVFNIADACVCIGAALLILHFIIAEVKEKKKKEKPESVNTPEDKTE